MKSWLEKNAVEMYSMDNEENFVISEIFFRTLKNNIDKYKTSVSKMIPINSMT